MKEAIALNKITQFVLLGLFLTIIIGSIFYFVQNWMSWQEEIKVFKTAKINSNILYLKNLNRGNYLIKLNIEDTIAEFDLPISYEVKRDGIKVGDSLSKLANSEKFEIYRIGNNNSSIKVSELTIY